MELTERMIDSDRRDLPSVGTTILIVFLLVMLVLVRLFSISMVSGTSMRNTVQDDDIILCGPAWNIRRGDIVTATTGKLSVIKRVVAVPGDRLLFVSEGEEEGEESDRINAKIELFVDMGAGFLRQDDSFTFEKGMNGRGFEQNMFIEGEYRIWHGEAADAPSEYVITMGKNEYFLMGDNRNFSRDSRSYGPFAKGDIIGKVLKVYAEGTDTYKFFNFFYSFLREINTDESQGVIIW